MGPIRELGDQNRGKGREEVLRVGQPKEERGFTETQNILRSRHRLERKNGKHLSLLSQENLDQTLHSPYSSHTFTSEAKI